MRRRREFSRRSMILVVILLLLPVIGFVAMPFKTFSVGDYRVDMYYNDVSYDGGQLFNSNVTLQPARVLRMNSPTSLSMEAEPQEPPVTNITTLHREDTGKPMISLSIGDPAMIDQNNIAVPYDPNLDIYTQIDQESSWNIKTYTMEFTTALATMLDTEKYSGVVLSDTNKSLYFDNDIHCDVNHWYKTDVMNDFSVVFTFGITGDVTEDKYYSIKGVNLVTGSLEQNVFIKTFDEKGDVLSFSNLYGSYVPNPAYPLFVAKLPENGPTIGYVLNENSKGVATSVTVTLSWSKVGPGVEYHPVFDKYSIINVLSKVKFDVVVELRSNIYNDAKIKLEDIPILSIPKFSTGYDWLATNWLFVVIALIIFVVVVIGIIYYIGRSNELFVGENPLGFFNFGSS